MLGAPCTVRRPHTEPMPSTSTVLRVPRDRLYATLHLYACDHDHDLSWRAVGVLTFLLSRPDGWTFYMGDIVGRHAEGREAVRTALRELEDAGYLDRTPQNHPGTGKLQGWLWVVRERPAGTVCPKTRPTGEPPDGNPGDIPSTTGSSNHGTKGAGPSTPAGLPTVPAPSTPPVQDTTEEDVVERLWSLWLEYLGVAGGPEPSLGTGKRHQALSLYHREVLQGGQHGVEVMFRATLRAVLASDWHMGTRDYQWPESLFRVGDPERRRRWGRKAQAHLQAARHDAQAGHYDPEWVPPEQQARRRKYDRVVQRPGATDG